MKLTVFQSEKGDCLLVTSGDGSQRILVDGGMRASYIEFVAPVLGTLATEQKSIQLVCVSHPDEDHIAGVLQLLDDEVAWRVHNFQISHGNPNHPAPNSPRPPKVEEIWHNAFHELLPDNHGEITDLLAANSSILAGSLDETILDIARQHSDLLASIPQAIQVSRRISSEQLGIPLNASFGGKLAIVRTMENCAASQLQMGPFRAYLLGPFSEDVEKLRQDWNSWLGNNKDALARLQKQAQRDIERLGKEDVNTILDLRLAQAQALGERTKVTPPNLASLMFLMEENERTLLLTGDGHADDVLKGLAFHGKLDAEGRIHVNALKIQHHGSENQ